MLTDHLVQVFNFLFQVLWAWIIHHGKRKTLVLSTLCGGKTKDQIQSSTVKTDFQLYEDSGESVLKSGDKYPHFIQIQSYTASCF